MTRRPGTSSTSSTAEVIVNAGAASPSCANASSRMWRSGPVRLSVEITVKSQAITSSSRSIAGGFEVGEHLLHRRASGLDLGYVGFESIAERQERVGRLDRGAGGVDEIAQADHDSVAFGVVRGRSQEQAAAGIVGGVRVELGPVRPEVAAGRVDDHAGRVGLERAGDVGDRRQPGRGRVDAGNEHERSAPGGEPVVAVLAVDSDVRRRPHSPASTTPRG